MFTIASQNRLLLQIRHRDPFGLASDGVSAIACQGSLNQGHEQDAQDSSRATTPILAEGSNHRPRGGTANEEHPSWRKGQCSEAYGTGRLDSDAIDAVMMALCGPRQS